MNTTEIDGVLPIEMHVNRTKLFFVKKNPKGSNDVISLSFYQRKLP